MSTGPLTAVRDHRAKAVRSSPRDDAIWLTAGVLLLALAVRLLAIADTPVKYDELYHLFAARSWAHDGTLRILDGEYPRAWGFTILVGWFLKLFGDGLVTARLPSAIAGAVLAAAVFAWTDRHAGRTAGWVAGLMVCFASTAIDLSTFARFYMLHALLFWLGAAIVYDAASGSGRRMPYWMLLAAAALFAAAWHLQVTTMIGLLGLLAWAAADALARRPLRPLLADRRAALGLAAAIVAVVGLAILLGLPAKLASLWREYRHAELWGIENQGMVLYYHYKFQELMPVLWNLAPAVIVIALAARPRPALFCTLLMAVPIVLHSLAGMKESRYVFYALPFFFAIWGIALGAVIPPFFRWSREAVDGLVAETRLWTPGELLRRLAAILLGVAAVSWAALGNPLFKETLDGMARHGAKLVRNTAALFDRPPDENWPLRDGDLRRMAGEASAVVVHDDLRAIFHLGDFDLMLSRSQLYQNTHGQAERREFTIDPRTGRPLISTAASLMRVMRCHATGVVLVPASRWRNEQFVPNDVADLLESTSEVTRFPIASSGGSLLAFRWQGTGVADRSDCEALRRR